MIWFGGDNRIEPSFDYQLFTFVLSWVLVYFLFLWFILTSQGRQMSSLAVGTASFLQGCLLHLSLHDNCWLHAQHHVQVHVDHYHADLVPALLQINIGLQTVNISAFNSRVFYYNEQFQILNGNLDEQLREALEKGAPDFILSVLEFLSDSHIAVPIQSTSYKIRYLLNMIFICWLFSLIVIIFIPHIAFKFFLLIGLSSCTICILYYWSTPHTLLLHIGQTCIVFNLGRSFYLSAAGGLSYFLLGIFYALGHYSDMISLNTCFEVDYKTPWDRKHMRQAMESRRCFGYQEKKRNSFYSTHSKPKPRMSVPNVDFYALPRISCKYINVKHRNMEPFKKRKKMTVKYKSERKLNIEEDILFQSSIDLNMFKTFDRKNTVF